MVGSSAVRDWWLPGMIVASAEASQSHLGSYVEAQKHRPHQQEQTAEEKVLTNRVGWCRGRHAAVGASAPSLPGFRPSACPLA